MSRLSLKQIEYFRAVMETGTVSGAAALLHVSQPNVSRMLEYTQSRLGLNLFQREHGRLVATPEALIAFDANTPHGRVVTQFFGQSRMMPRIACTVRFAESACALAEQGNGIALVDEFTVAGGAFPNLIAIPVRFRRPFRIYFHRARERPLSAAGVRLRELLSRWQ